MPQRTHTISFRIDEHYLTLLEREASKFDPPSERRGRGRKPKKVSVHDAARRFVCDALDDVMRKQLLGAQEFLANRLETLSQEMEEEFQALRDDLGKDLKSVIEAMGRQKGR